MTEHPNVPGFKRRIRAAWFALLGRPLVFNVTVQHAIGCPPTFLIRGGPVLVDGLVIQPQPEGWKRTATFVVEDGIGWFGPDNIQRVFPEGGHRV